MEVLRSWTLFLLLVLAVSRCTDARSSRHRREPDEYIDEDGPAPSQHSSGVQNDNPEEEAQQDDVDEDADADADLPPSRLLSTALVVDAARGETVQLPCTIENQANGVIKWAHETKPVKTELYQATQSHPYKIDKSNKVKLLANWSIEIPSVTVADAGEYTCDLISPHQKVTHVLRVAPEIVDMSPQARNRQVVEGTALRITCKAEGYPQPTLRWSKVVGQENKRVTEEQAHFEKESILIRNVTREDAGTYFCMAENNVGKPAAREVTIQVLGKPRVHIHRNMENGAIGEHAYLHCTVHEQPESNIKWLKDGEPLESSADLTITLRYPHSDVSIPVVREKDFGNYTCMAANQYGNHSRSVELVEAPVLEELVVNDNVLEFKVHSHQPLQDVQIEYRRTDQDNAGWQNLKVKPEATSEKHVHLVRFPTSSLQAGEYEATARAHNQRGWSERAGNAFFTAEEPQRIQAAGVATNPSGTTNLRSTMTVLVSTVATCLLVRLI